MENKFIERYLETFEEYKKEFLGDRELRDSMLWLMKMPQYNVNDAVMSVFADRIFKTLKERLGLSDEELMQAYVDNGVCLSFSHMTAPDYWDWLIDIGHVENYNLTCPEWVKNQVDEYHIELAIQNEKGEAYAYVEFLYWKKRFDTRLKLASISVKNLDANSVEEVLDEKIEAVINSLRGKRFTENNIWDVMWDMTDAFVYHLRSHYDPEKHRKRCQLRIEPKYTQGQD